MARHSRLPTVDCAASPEARFESAVAVVLGRMYVIGGHKEPHLSASEKVLAYDPVADRWEERCPCPKQISHVTAAVSDDRHIWIVGGFEGQHPGRAVNTTFRYDAVEDKWDDGPPLPQTRASGGLALIGRNLHFFGGLDADRSTNRSDHWVLDIDRLDGWVPLADAPRARSHAATAVFDDMIYIIGGHFGHDVPGQPGKIARSPDLTDVHRYRPDEDRWEQVSFLRQRRSHCETSTFIMDGRIICIAGRSNNPGGRVPKDVRDLRWFVWRIRREILERLGLQRPNPGLDDVVAYDPNRDSWAALGRIPEGLYAPAAAEINGMVIVTNGGRKGWQYPSDRTFRLQL